MSCARHILPNMDMRACDRGRTMSPAESNEWDLVRYRRGVRADCEWLIAEIVKRTALCVFGGVQMSFQ